MRLSNFFGILTLLISLNAQASLDIVDFDININFLNEDKSAGDSKDWIYALTTSQQTIFSQAESFWESLLVGYWPGVNLPGLNITASGVDIDEVGNVLGQAGPLTAYKNPTMEVAYVASGHMKFDIADLQSMENNNTLFDVIVHEMAHVIGFGTLWNAAFANDTVVYNNVLDANNNYIGALGLTAYRQEYDANALFVPIEDGGGAGTAGGHWDEETFLGGTRKDIMTGYLDPPTTMSQTTMYAFADMGYVIAPMLVPEPSTFAILLLSLIALCSWRRKPL